MSFSKNNHLSYTFTCFTGRFFIYSGINTLFYYLKSKFIYNCQKIGDLLFVEFQQEKKFGKKYDYEMSIHPDEKENWISWKQEYMNMPEGKRISYFGFLDNAVICEATAALSSDAGIWKI